MKTFLKNTKILAKKYFFLLLSGSLAINLGSCQVKRSYGNSQKINEKSNKSHIIAQVKSLEKRIESSSLEKANSTITTLDPERSFRGVWVATVANIDWPKNPNDSFDIMQQDYIALLEFYKNLNFNAVVVQIRTAGDAFYPSSLAPWSRFLSGTEGLAPNTKLDPLHWLISTTHEYGMDFHAWINPYRATMSLDTKILSPSHDYMNHPDWMLPYGNKIYYNPGIPEVTEKLTQIVGEIVTNYDVDGIHLDDYFYPYKIKNEKFNDQNAYRASGTQKGLEDWRRDNINRLIQNIQLKIKDTKPWVAFGVSPFGVWKNKSTDPIGSDTRAGQTTFEDLYADPLKWMQEGWIDYLAPQLYWSMEYDLASHKKLIDWWSTHKTNSKIYIGNGPYKIFNNSDKAWDQPNEISKQLSYAKLNKNIEGHIFFSAKSFMAPKLNEVVTQLKENSFSQIVLPPIYRSRLEGKSFNWEVLLKEQSKNSIFIESNDPEVNKWIAYSFNNDSGQYESQGVFGLNHGIININPKKISLIKGVNRMGQLSQIIKISE